LGYTAGQRRHGGDVSAVRFPLKDDRIAHGFWPLILIIPANVPGGLGCFMAGPMTGAAFGGMYPARALHFSPKGPWTNRRH
jgi:hypothetical protein